MEFYFREWKYAQMTLNILRLMVERRMISRHFLEGSGEHLLQCRCYTSRSASIPLDRVETWNRLCIWVESGKVGEVLREMSQSTTLGEISHEPIPKVYEMLMNAPSNMEQLRIEFQESLI